MVLDADRIGPVEYALIAFPSTEFDGRMAAALVRLVQGGIVRIIDLTFVAKDPDGTVRGTELDELPAHVADSFADLDGFLRPFQFGHFDPEFTQCLEHFILWHEVAALVGDRADADFYICGPGPYMDTVEAGLAAILATSVRRAAIDSDVPTMRERL